MWTVRFVDSELICEQCHRPFVWSAGDQEFYAVQGFDHAPRRCHKCRAERRQVMHIRKKSAIQHEVTCERCGSSTTVPFIPHQGRPVYCRDCFTKLRQTEDAA